MSVEDLTVEYGGNTIKGLFYKPETRAKNYPLVVCCHGFGSKYEWLMEYARRFCDAGACAAIFDFCGGGKESRSSGSPLDLSVLSEARDTEAVLKYCKSFDFIDKSRVYLLGESMGGMVATLVASRRPEDFKALMLLYPGYSMPYNARKTYASAEEIPEKIDAGRMVVGKKFYADIYDIQPYELSEKINCPVYIIHGDRDTVVPLCYSQKAEQVFENCKLSVMPGLPHGFEGEDIVTAAGMFKEFLKENM